MGRLRFLGYGTAGTAFVVILVLVLDKIPIHEDEHDDEYEKNQIKSHAYALRPFFTQSHLPLCFALRLVPFLIFRIPHL